MTVQSVNEQFEVYLFCFYFRVFPIDVFPVLFVCVLLFWKESYGSGILFCQR